MLSCSGHDILAHCKTYGYWSLLTGETIHGYCTHYEAGCIVSDERAERLASEGVIVYKNIYCPRFLTVKKTAKENLLKADYHLLSVFVLGKCERCDKIYLSLSPHPAP